jgi:hypothetical protein
MAGYSAVVWFQRKYQSDGVPLPSHFSKDLGLELTDNPDENLCALVKRHKELSDSLTVMYAGTLLRRRRGL